jgi:hypothetical protein
MKSSSALCGTVLVLLSAETASAFAQLPSARTGSSAALRVAGEKLDLRVQTGVEVSLLCSAITHSCIAKIRSRICFAR